MEQEVKERICEFIKYKGFSVRYFEEKCELSNGYMRKLRHSPTAEKVEQILRAFPELSRDWLMAGEGEMLRPESVSQTVNGNHNTQVAGNGNNLGAPNAEIFLAEITAQRMLTERALAQIDKLTTIIQHLSAGIYDEKREA